MMNKLSAVDWIALILVIIGGLNWGLVGVFDFDLVGTIFGAISAITRVVYILVGLSAIYVLAISKSSGSNRSSPGFTTVEGFCYHGR